MSIIIFCFFFFFQAEDGIRDHCVTGVQTCAFRSPAGRHRPHRAHLATRPRRPPRMEIGRASCRGKSVDLGGRRIIKKKKKRKNEKKKNKDNKTTKKQKRHKTN